MDELQGRLLVANGNLFDPNFRQAVVLVIEHNDSGAVGVVLNRPAPVSVAETVPVLAGIVPEDSLYIGGPVEPQGAVVLVEYEQAALAEGLVFGSVGVLHDEPDEATAVGIARARVFAGYAGWAPSQLEAELSSSSWIIDQPTERDVFTSEPEHLWREVLKRKGGDYALMSLMPFDPSTN